MTTRRTSSFRRAAIAAARAADQKKALDIKLYDVRRFSPLAEYYLVATVESAPQAEAVDDEIDQALRAGVRARICRREGRARTAWRVLDYGGLVVHLMSESARDFFGVERLWEAARSITWQEKRS